MHSVWWMGADSQSIQSEDIKSPLLEMSDFLPTDFITNLLLVNNLLAKKLIWSTWISWICLVCVYLFIYSSSQTPSLCKNLVIMFSSMFSDHPKTSSKVHKLFKKFPCLIHGPEIKQHPKCFSLILYHNISSVWKWKIINESQLLRT